MPTIKLNEKDRKFLTTLSNLMVKNPFDVDTKNALALLAPIIQINEPNADDTHFFYYITAPLNAYLADLTARGFDNVQKLENKDRKLLEDAFFFAAYLNYFDKMDTLIQQQLLQTQPVKVEFSNEFIKHLNERGFDHADAIRILSLCYQFRRGYYFIGQALIGQSDAMKALRCALWDNVFTFNARHYSDFLWNCLEDFSTLILGATGTGKGAAAQAVAHSGLILYDEKTNAFAQNFQDSFLSINLSEYPESLIESALFGHKKGAFTGATSNFDGIFKRCLANGTLFLDEIAEVSQTIQVKLLNVLQQRKFTPIGSQKSEVFRGRIMAATHQDIALLRQQGSLRHDLYYRLSSAIIKIPTLQQRLEENDQELKELSQLLLTRITGRENLELSLWLQQQLKKSLPKNYPWPGNVRELEQAVRRVLLTQTYEGDEFASPSKSADFTDLNLSAKQLLQNYCQTLYQRFNSIEKVARVTELDRRTVKKYLEG